MHNDEIEATDAVSTAEGSLGPTLEVGAKVYVRSRYVGQWSAGFEVAAVLDDGYRLRRLSDGYAFPDVFPFDDVRGERRQQPTRGIGSSYLDRRD